MLDETNLTGSLTSEYVFFGGKRIAMRNVSTGVIYYYEEDMLGSSRTIVQAGQTTPCYDGDFYPFGGERIITNSCSQNYKFEGKERDTESGNDNFGARYYRSALGRWMSPDWSAIPAPVPYANLTNPATLNLYAMVSDNPETFADLDGHECTTGPDGVTTCKSDAQTTAAPPPTGGKDPNPNNNPNCANSSATCTSTTQQVQGQSSQQQTFEQQRQAAQEMAQKDVASPDPLGDAIIGAVAGAVVSAVDAVGSLIGDAVGSGSRVAAEDATSAAVPKPGSANAEGAGKAFTKAVGDAAREESGDRCVLCGHETTREPGPYQSNIDHSIPRSRGGDNSLANAQNTCRTCNLRKGAMTTIEYIRKFIPPLVP